MIFLTTGTSPCPFQRLVDIAAQLADEDEVVLQHGSAQPPAGVPGFAYAAPAAIAELMQSADVVVCHGGAGSTALALSVGLRPIVLPRRAELGENLDNHQVTFAERLARDGLIALCSNADDVIRHSKTNRTPVPPITGPSPKLIKAISDTISNARTATNADNQQRHP